MEEFEKLKKATSAYILFRCHWFVEQTCVRSNEEDIYNNVATCNSVPYRSIAIESSNKE